ncbi:glycosyltransferase [Polycladidibacter stylochi]|uniref:glycosyltransferase n=1 Tax=Polycladidibacter stylochi TaxID=1807766 RepID=UPI00082A51F7|nr:glycosyltransferase [Pseudovibrio stylochi]
MTISKSIALCITSCGRKNVLEKTLDSFMPYHSGSFSEKYLVEDAGSVDIAQYMKKAYPDVKVLLNNEQLGQMKSIDKMYSLVKSEYIFHGEDDWLFEAKNTINECFEVLAAEPMVSVVCVRKLSDLQEKFQRNCIRKEVNGVKYALMPLDIHPEWLSFSFNPGLVRKKLWDKYGPYEKYKTEERISIVMKREGLMVAFLDPGYCHHIGDGMHVNDPNQPIRAKTFLQRMKRSIMKRIKRFIRRFGYDI